MPPPVIGHVGANATTAYADPYGARWTALTQPGAALFNADSYEFFATSTPRCEYRPLRYSFVATFASGASDAPWLCPLVGACNVHVEVNTELPFHHAKAPIVVSMYNENNRAAHACVRNSDIETHQCASTPANPLGSIRLNVSFQLDAVNYVVETYVSAPSCASISASTDSLATRLSINGVWSAVATADLQEVASSIASQCPPPSIVLGASITSAAASSPSSSVPQFNSHKGRRRV
jgi:hypothetical protein